MAAGKRGSTYHRRSSFWPGEAVDPRSLVDRPCRFNPDLFTSDNRADQQVAKMSCAGCPQRDACLAHGLRLDDLVDTVSAATGKVHNLIRMHGTEGVWGGMTRLERLRQRRKGA